MERPFDDEKELVFMIMMMPDKFAQQLGQFDMLAVELPDNFWGPVVVKQAKLVS